MTISGLLHKVLVSVILIMLLGFFSETVKAVQDSDKNLTSENHDLSIADLQENFHLEEAVYQETVTGQIIDAITMNPLPGATIIVQGTNIGTSTDINGNFELNVPSLNEILVITYIGYDSIEEPIDGRTEINISLEASAFLVDDVVVTALGIAREARALGYSISRVSPEDMTVNRTTNFIDALEGRMAGVNVTSLSTGPGGSSRINIRGQSSFGDNNRPLIVVNGVPIDNTSFGLRGGEGDRGTSRNSDAGDGLSSINPDDIEDLTVLKGAAASALYGSRGKDGVILITTRNRAAGTGLQIEYNSNFTLEMPIDYTDFQQEYGQGERGVRAVPGDGSGVWSFGERIESGMTYEPFAGVVIPYEAQGSHVKNFYQNGYNISNAITLSQGTATGGFNLSLSNLTSQGIMPMDNDSYGRNTISLGFTETLANRFTLSGNVNYSRQSHENPPNMFEQDYSPVVIYTMANTMPLNVLQENAFTEEGDEVFWSRFTNRTNPYVALSRFDNIERDRVYGNLTARLNLADWIFVQGRLGQDYWNREQDYNLPTGTQRQGPAPPGLFNGQYIQDQRSMREVNADLLVNATQEFGEFGLNGNFGGNIMYRKNQRRNVLGTNFYSRGLYSLDNASDLSPIFSMSEMQVNSLYGSGEVSWRDFVFVTGTLRNDWFSTLARGNRSISYPSISGSFVFSQAFAFNLPEWITYGKIRGSYAEVGTDADIAPYSNNLFYSINQNLRPNIDGVGQPLGSISGSVVPSPDLRPMRVKETEVGLEMTLFDNLSFEVAHYIKVSTDQIMNVQIPDASGFTGQRVNLGEHENRGWEMMVSISPVRSTDFNWTLSANAAHNRSKVTDLGGEISDSEFIQVATNENVAIRHYLGQPLGQIWGNDFLYDDQGRQIFNENNGLPLWTSEPVYLGNSIPNWTGGITNNFNYRNLSASFLIDFRLGHRLFSWTHHNIYRHGLDKKTLPGREEGFIVGDGVNPDGSVNTTPAEVQSFYEVVRTGRIAGGDTFDASNWQLRQITVGYNLTPHLPAGLGIRNLRLNLVLNNVAVLKNWDVPHLHPSQVGMYGDNQMGLESTALPVTRSIGFNLNVQI